jgi:hypothetical protein
MPVEPELVLVLPVDALALHLLKKFDDESIVLHRYNFFVIADSAYKNAGVTDPVGILRALAEALDWLTQHGLINAHGQEKLSEANFLATLRIASVAKTKARAKHLVQKPCNALNSTRGPHPRIWRMSSPEVTSRAWRSTTRLRPS